MAGQDAPFPDLGGLTFSEDVFYRLLDDFFSSGVVGSATDYQVIQNHLGANMSVDVNPGSGYVAIANGGKRRTRLPAQSNSGIPGTPNSADNWTTTFVAADPTNPRIDRVVLTAQDSSVDGSGFYRSILRVVAGTPTSGATLLNLNGAAAVPVNSILLANVLVPNSATTVTTANISDQRPLSKVGGGNAQLNVQAGVVPVASTITALNALLAGGAPVAGQKAMLRLQPATYNNGGATALPAATITVGDTTELPTAGTMSSPNGDIAYTGKTATTLTGCTGGTGTLAANAPLVLKTGTPINTSYDLIGLTYDAVLGKWVSPIEPITWDGNAASNAVSTTSATFAELLVGAGTGPSFAGWRAYDAAGLKPQLRVRGSALNNTTGMTVTICPSFDGANVNVQAPNGPRNHNGGDATAAGPAAPVGGTFTANNIALIYSLWGNIPGGYTLYDHFLPGVQMKVSGGSGTLETFAWDLRWVG